MTKSAVSCSLVTFTIEILNGKLQVLCSITQIIETEKKMSAVAYAMRQKVSNAEFFPVRVFPYIAI